jgi:probable phosphoglycerate mutase
MGIWDNRPFCEIKSRYREAYEQRGKDILHYRVEGGENFAEVALRAQNAIDKIRQTDCRDLLFITHLGVIRSLLHRSGRLDEQDFLNFKLAYGDFIHY